MARLPTVGGDDGNWGTVLNDYLSQEHNADGTHALDASDITYTPVDNSKWTGSVDPGATDDGLDQLASRVTTVEAGIGAGSDTTAIHDNVSSEISAITEKTTPVTADLILIEDSADTNAKKKVQVGNLPFSTNPTITSISPTTTNVTASVNTNYFADISGLTANRNFVIPAGSAGDEISLNIKVGDDTYFLVIIGDTGITINSGSAATVWGYVRETGISVRLVATSTTNWQIVSYERSSELDYVEFTSSVNPTATTEGTANSVVTGNAIVYDGITPVIIEFFANNARPNASVGPTMTFWLYDGANSIGQIGLMLSTDAAGDNKPIHVLRRITPSAGSHTYSIRASVSSGTGLIGAGSGGAGTAAPGFLRIARASP